MREILGSRSLVATGQTVCRNAETRFGVIEDKYFEDNETTFEKFHRRITGPIELRQSIDEHGMDGLKNETVIMKTARTGSFEFNSRRSYVADYAMPDFISTSPQYTVFCGTLEFH